MLHINRVKTFDGLRWAVVNTAEKTVVNENGKKETVLESYVVEYDNGSRIDVATFPHNEEGFLKAKEVRNLLLK